MDKSRTFYRLVHAFFHLEAEKGHMRWSVAQLARSSKVSRALVYRYLGATKKEIARNCIRCFTENVYGFEIADQKEFAEGFASNLVFTRARISEAHDAILFYQKWRVRDGWVRDEFVDVEKRFHARLRKTFPKLDDDGVLALRTSLHGLLTAPFLESGKVAKVIDELVRRYR